MVVVEIAKSGRSTCRTCRHLIEQDTIRIGTTISNEGYINIEWHHEECFWTKRARQYFFRKNKKINTTLKYEQFSGTSFLTPEKQEEFHRKILEANLRWGTDAALAKAGIVRDSGNLEAKEEETASPEDVPEATSAAKKKNGKRTAEVDPNDGDKDGDQRARNTDLCTEEKGGRKKRKKN